MPEIERHWHQDEKVRPYSAAAVFGGVVYACGQVPTLADGSTPATMTDQVAAVFDNLEGVLDQAGASLTSLLKLTVFVADFDEFDEFNEAYLFRLEGYALPPRTTVQVARFRGEKRIEIDAIAAVIGENTAV
ncbi:RidA family protein [Arthrobacter rhombi]|uniref:RidA family protein n=1 Tax=Arthrobacter rhombi TaxID=71253 RepID=UPI003FD49CB9